MSSTKLVHSIMLKHSELYKNVFLKINTVHVHFYSALLQASHRTFFHRRIRPTYYLHNLVGFARHWSGERELLFV